MSRFVAIFCEASASERTASSFTPTQSLSKRRWCRIGTLCAGRAVLDTHILLNPLPTKKARRPFMPSVQIVGVLWGRDTKTNQGSFWQSRKCILLR